MSKIAVVLLTSTFLFAQSPDTIWTRTYGGPGNDMGYSVEQTVDGGFIIAVEYMGSNLYMLHAFITFASISFPCQYLCRM